MEEKQLWNTCEWGYCTVGLSPFMPTTAAAVWEGAGAREGLRYKRKETQAPRGSCLEATAPSSWSTNQWTESMKDRLYLGLETTKFFKTFSFSLGKTNKSSSFHLQEDSWGMTELRRCQDDLEKFWGFLSGPRSENYWILATSLSAKATLQIAQKYPRIKGVKRWDIY